MRKLNTQKLVLSISTGFVRKMQIRQVIPGPAPVRGEARSSRARQAVTIALAGIRPGGGGDPDAGRGYVIWKSRRHEGMHRTPEKARK
jgi:hypothetical protein